MKRKYGSPLNQVVDQLIDVHPRIIYGTVGKTEGHSIRYDYFNKSREILSSSKLNQRVIQ